MLFILSFLFLIATPLFSYASNHCIDGQLCNPIVFNTISEFLEGLLGLVILIGFPIVVLFIVFIGFRLVQASATGDEKGLTESKKYFLWAIVGALILLGAQALSIAIQGTVTDLSTGL